MIRIFGQIIDGQRKNMLMWSYSESNDVKEIRIGLHVAIIAVSATRFLRYNLAVSWGMNISYFSKKNEYFN